MDEIQALSKPVLKHCYHEFLLRSADPEEREYLDPADQIREVLIHENYMSQRDVDFCLEFDLEGRQGEEGFEGMKELHDALASGAP